MFDTSFVFFVIPPSAASRGTHAGFFRLQQDSVLPFLLLHFLYSPFYPFFISLLLSFL